MKEEPLALVPDVKREHDAPRVGGSADEPCGSDDAPRGGGSLHAASTESDYEGDAGIPPNKPKLAKGIGRCFLLVPPPHF